MNCHPLNLELKQCVLSTCQSIFGSKHGKVRATNTMTRGPWIEPYYESL
jgi:hypothetical protein